MLQTCGPRSRTRGFFLREGSLEVLTEKELLDKRSLAALDLIEAVLVLERENR